MLRIRSLGEPISGSITKAAKPYETTIRNAFTAVAPELQSVNAYRYANNITGGIQEFMESLLFQHYLATQTLLSYEESEVTMNELVAEQEAVEGEDRKGKPQINLTPEDYILGVYDMTGELMRFSITAMATTGNLPSGSRETDQDVDMAESGADASTRKASQRTALSDIREIEARLQALDVEYGSRFHRDAESKAKVLHQCVEKVERALYGLVVRGSERPKGWVPDEAGGGRQGPEEIESY